ncbi:Orn/Lys/Arg decarboxylase [Chondrocystis sp. NIES-4102]|nr:Orn/Lys/Arg decarboxylase [Chondrocystis sp. NIES-4102]
MLLNSDGKAIPLVDALKKSSQQAHAAFYAPGHKQGKGSPDQLKNLISATALTVDLPELPELDNLFAPVGVIAQAEELAAETFGASKTWFLINGSSCGIIAAILATCSQGEKIILPRNIHISAIAGLVLSGAIPIFIYPEYDLLEGLSYNVTPKALQQALIAHPDAKAVMILHPTYQGICSDLSAIAEITHQYDIPLLVDEAHGAHFAFHPDLPPSAMSVGADITIQSTHKVLTAMTQASMLHLQGSRVDQNRISKALQLVQSTSPSYLLLASLDAARQQMATQGRELMNKTLTLAAKAREELAILSNISVLNPQTVAGCQHLDLTRLTLNVSQLGITGFEADEILHEQFKVTCELPLLHHLCFIISLGNNQDDIKQLVEALTSLSEGKINSPPLTNIPQPITINQQPITISPRDAYFAPTQTIPISQASDRLCGELICPYPPGIPLLMPGEIITPVAINYLQQVLNMGGTITGCKDPSLNTIQVLK